MKELQEEGYYVVYLDESYINTNYSPKRLIQDLNINTAKQAKDQNLTTGLTRLSGKGERLILIGAGGSDGWANYEIIQRSKNKQSNMDYHQDMDSQIFEEFLHATLKILTDRYNKIVILLDNTSYHNAMSNNVPRSNWTL